VAPHGGTEARFGTNPIAFGFPTAEHLKPFAFRKDSRNSRP
jgi:LDH2 family malate/lactate/ureidoglycolate dehydrogenase